MRTGQPLADAMTVNPYLGRDSVEPFLAACRREGAGVFCLVKTSNEGGADIQDLELSDGRPLWQHVARLVSEWGEDLVGERGLSSVGRSRGRDISAGRRARRGGSCRGRSCSCRESAPRAPGPADVARAFTSGPASALVTASRSVLYAFRASDERLALGGRRTRRRG